LGSDPNGRLVEITAFRKAIFRTTAEVNGPLLIKDQAISADFEGHQAATTLPDHVQAATGWPAAETPFVGAR
jgi:hypothetical protein